MSDNPTTPSQFFAVTWGSQRGVFDNYREAQAAMKGFPSPVYKKFKNRDEAEDFVKRSQPESTSFEADESDQKFYAVARGRVIGIFKDLETAKQNVKGFPNAMHKKFGTMDEAKRWVEKYSEGKVDETTPKKGKAENGGGTAEAGSDVEMEKQQKEAGDGAVEKQPQVDGQQKKEEEAEEVPTTKAIARKRTYDTNVDAAGGDVEMEKQKEEAGEPVGKQPHVDGEGEQKKTEEAEEVPTSDN